MMNASPACSFPILAQTPADLQPDFPIRQLTLQTAFAAKGVFVPDNNLPEWVDTTCRHNASVNRIMDRVSLGAALFALSYFALALIPGLFR